MKTLSPSTITLFSLASCCAGAGFSQHFPFAPLLFLSIGLSLAIFILPILNRQLTLSLIFILSCGLLGIARGHYHQHISDPTTLDWYASEEGHQLTLIGFISEEPDIRRDKINYTLTVTKPASGTVLISSGKYPQYHYGDTLQVSGRLQIPTRFDTFDYAGYLARYGIHSVMYQPFVTLLSEFDPATASPGQRFMAQMLDIKAHFELAMNRTFSTEPFSSFMAGLLLGSRKGIPDQLSEDFRITGLTHIIAISGYNITLIVTILMGLFKPFGRRPAILLSAIGIIVFTLFVGASAAVVRACIMGLIALVALNSERKGQITMTLLLTASIMILWNPLILIQDVGFQLSFLATMGLIYVSPLLEPWFQWLPKTLGIRESILLTLSAQIMALPIILLNFQNLSLVSPLANLLVAGPILPLTMLFGFLATLTSWFSLVFAKVIAYPAYLLLSYVVTAVHLAAQAPYATIEISWFNEPLLVGFFSFLSLILLFTWQRQHQRIQRIKRQQVEIWQQLHQCRFTSCQKGILALP